MHDPDKIPDARPHRDKEYEDFHFHDDDDVIPADDTEPRTTRPPSAYPLPQPKGERAG